MGQNAVDGRRNRAWNLRKTEPSRKRAAVKGDFWPNRALAERMFQIGRMPAIANLPGEPKQLSPVGSFLVRPLQDPLIPPLHRAYDLPLWTSIWCMAFLAFVRIQFQLKLSSVQFAIPDGFALQLDSKLSPQWREHLESEEYRWWRTRAVQARE